MKQVTFFIFPVVFISSCETSKQAGYSGLISFSAISTKDALSQKKKEELENAEAASRVQNEAVLATITDITGKMTDFLNGQN